MPISQITSINFSKIKIDELILNFGLKQTNNLIFPLSNFDLIKNNTVDELTQLNNLIQKSQNQISYWNKQEIIINLIAPLLAIADINGDNYKTFFERNISAIVQNKRLTGTVDMMVAFGIHNPIKPYFFIQEYKRSKLGADSDPLAQLLAEMLVAQQINQVEMVLGCYVVGKDWFFVILNRLEFTQTKSFDSTDIEDLQVILNYLKSVKQYIEIELKK